MSGYVWMTNPDLPDNEPVQASAQAFNASWRHRGWVECDPPPDPTQAELDATVAPIAELVVADPPDDVEVVAQPGESVLTKKTRTKE